jgi:hypothetical protein
LIHPESGRVWNLRPVFTVARAQPGRVELPTAIRNPVLLDIGFVLGFQRHVLAVALPLIRAKRMDLGLEATDLFVL